MSYQAIISISFTGRSLEEMAEVFGDEIDPNTVLSHEEPGQLDEKSVSENVKHNNVVPTA